MATLIKEEPLELDEIDHVTNESSKNKISSLLDKQFESELFYLNNINENVLNSNSNEDLDFLNDLASMNQMTGFLNNLNVPKSNEFTIENVINKINTAQVNINDDQFDNEASSESEIETKQLVKKNKEKLKTKNKSNQQDSGISKEKWLKQKQEQIVIEKKKILAALVESEKEKNLNSKMNKYEPIGLDEENKLLKKLNNFLNDNNLTKQPNDLSTNKMFELNRFRAKLELRKLKRKNYCKIFDIDSYVNELIDREKMYLLKTVKQNKFKKESIDNENANVNKHYEDNNDDDDDEEDDDIIFESATLKTVPNNENNSNDSNCDITEITNVLDRFKNKKIKLDRQAYLSDQLYFHSQQQLPIGIVESRNDDIKCLISPFTNNILKPYVWKDFKSLPIKLDLNRQIIERNSTLADKIEQRSSIDYVHLRPEHVLQINMMCRQHFWAGIDISECLQYPDYTLVALYKKLIIGFAFLVPNTSHKEAYLSFIFVHPDWRTFKNVKNSQNNNFNVSIGQYMLYYLIQKCSDCDVTLHVSVNSPVVVFYQKFGFKIEEYIKNFYDKYYSDEHNLSKDAFLMRLSKN